MTLRTALRRDVDAAAYWSQWVLLQMFGPATQDDQSDPIHQLKRKYGREVPPQ
jgi:hypothetical protein